MTENDNDNDNEIENENENVTDNANFLSRSVLSDRRGWGQGIMNRPEIDEAINYLVPKKLNEYTEREPGPEPERTSLLLKKKSRNIKTQTTDDTEVSNTLNDKQL